MGREWLSQTWVCLYITFIGAVCADSFCLLWYGAEHWNELELRCGLFPLYYQKCPVQSRLNWFNYLIVQWPLDHLYNTNFCATYYMPHTCSRPITILAPT